MGSAEERAAKRAQVEAAETSLSAALHALDDVMVRPAPEQGGPTVWIWDAVAGAWRRYFIRLTEVK